MDIDVDEHVAVHFQDGQSARAEGQAGRCFTLGGLDGLVLSPDLGCLPLARIMVGTRVGCLFVGSAVDLAYLLFNDYHN